MSAADPTIAARMRRARRRAREGLAHYSLDLPQYRGVEMLMVLGYLRPNDALDEEKARRAMEKWAGDQISRFSDTAYTAKG